MKHDLCARIAHLLETYKDCGFFSSDELWQRRTRECIETTALPAFCAGAELSQFGDMARPPLVGDMGWDQNMQESSLVGKD
jgi:hypothetical protein